MACTVHSRFESIPPGQNTQTTAPNNTTSKHRTWKILKRHRSRKETAVLRCIVSVRPEVGRFSSSTNCTFWCVLVVWIGVGWSDRGMGYGFPGATDGVS